MNEEEREAFVKLAAEIALVRSILLRLCATIYKGPAGIVFLEQLDIPVVEENPMLAKQVQSVLEDFAKEFHSLRKALEG